MKARKPIKIAVLCLILFLAATTAYSKFDNPGTFDTFMRAVTQVFRTGSVGMTITSAGVVEVTALGLAIETVTGNTTLGATHSTLLVNASGSVTTTLPTATSAYNSTDGIGRIYTIKKIDADADTVTLDGNGAELIDGASTAVLTVQFESITTQSNGTSWYIH